MRLGVDVHAAAQINFLLAVNASVGAGANMSSYLQVMSVADNSGSFGIPTIGASILNLAASPSAFASPQVSAAPRSEMLSRPCALRFCLALVQPSPVRAATAMM